MTNRMCHLELCNCMHADSSPLLQGGEGSSLSLQPASYLWARSGEMQREPMRKQRLDLFTNSFFFFLFCQLSYREAFLEPVPHSAMTFYCNVRHSRMGQ